VNLEGDRIPGHARAAGRNELPGSSVRRWRGHGFMTAASLLDNLAFVLNLKRMVVAVRTAFP
jgi:hypothetical protein